MQFDFIHIWSEMSGLSKGIAVCLLLFAIASIGVIVERVIAFTKAAKVSKQFAVAARPLLEKWDVEGLVEAAKKHKASPLANLFEGMSVKYLDGIANRGNMTPVELARNESFRRQEALGAEL